MLKESGVFTFDFDRETDKGLFERYSEISLLLAGIPEDNFINDLNGKLIKDKRYKVTVEEL